MRVGDYMIMEYRRRAGMLGMFAIPAWALAIGSAHRGSYVTAAIVGAVALALSVGIIRNLLWVRFHKQIMSD